MVTLLELAKIHGEAEDRQDAEAAAAAFSEDCVYTIDAFGITLNGRDQAREHYEGAFEAFPDFVNKEVIWHDAGDDVFGRALVEFTFDKPWNGIQPNGKRVSIWSIGHFPKGSDGLLGGEHVYVNGNDFLYQMGALPSSNAMELAQYIKQLEHRIEELEASGS